MANDLNGTGSELGAYVRKDADTDCYIVRCPSLNVVTAVRDQERAAGAIVSAANLINRHQIRMAIAAADNRSARPAAQFDLTVPLAAV